MTSQQLFESIAYLDPALLESSEHPIKNKPRLRPVAAALCIGTLAAALLLPMLHRTDNLLHGDVTTPPGQEFTLTFQSVESVEKSQQNFFCITGNPLSNDPIREVFPDDLPEELAITSATAEYFGWGELYQLCLEFKNPSWDGKTTLLIYRTDRTSAPSDEAASSLSDNGTEPTAYEYIDEENDTCLLWATFTRDGITFRAYANTDTAHIDQAKSDMTAILGSYANSKDVSHILPADKDNDEN